MKFLSPLAKAQDGEDLLNVQQAIAFVNQSAGSDYSMMSFKLEDLGQWAAEKTGMPTELVRSSAEKEQIIQAGAEAAQAGVQGGQGSLPMQ